LAKNRQIKFRQNLLPPNFIAAKYNIFLKITRKARQWQIPMQ